VRREGKRIVIKAGDVKAEVEFKLLKGKRPNYLSLYSPSTALHAGVHV